VTVVEFVSSVKDSVHIEGKKKMAKVVKIGKKKMSQMDKLAVAHPKCSAKKMQKAFVYMERKKMVQEAYQSCLAEVQRRADIAAPTGKTAKKFANGTAVLQWWSDWFKNLHLTQPLAHYKKNKKRPAWFSGEVLQYAGWDAIKYAGRVQEPGHLYDTY
jgi:hypothetical protein